MEVFQLNTRLCWMCSWSPHLALTPECHHCHTECDSCTSLQTSPWDLFHFPAHILLAPRSFILVKFSRHFNWKNTEHMRALKCPSQGWMGLGAPCMVEGVPAHGLKSPFNPDHSVLVFLYLSVDLSQGQFTKAAIKQSQLNIKAHNVNAQHQNYHFFQCSQLQHSPFWFSHQLR